MSRRKKGPAFTWCTTCEEKAFVKGTRGSILDLDCGHSVNAGQQLAMFRRDEHAAGPPRLVRKDKTPTWGARQAKAPAVTPTPPAKPQALKPDVKTSTKTSTSSFNPTHVANMVDDLLKGKKR